MMSRISSLLFVLLAHTACARMYQGLVHGLDEDDLLYAEEQASEGLPIPPEYTIDIPVDHFDHGDNRTFKNHYWVNDSYYQSGGPVFFYDAGEAGVSNSTVLVVLAEAVGPSAPMALARKYGGLAIAWEHRFYGQSLPFELDNTTGIAYDGYDAYKYLTNEQALEDVVYFAQHFAPASPKIWRYRNVLHPSRTPWVFIGGSYPGVRAAMIRKRNPETWFAGWASSAPVQAQIDMSVYFRPIEQAMPRNCSRDMHLAVQYADGVLCNGSKTQVQQLREAVYLLGELRSSVDHIIHNATGPDPVGAAGMQLWDIARILAYAVSFTSVDYQSNGFAVSLQPFCNYFEQYDPNHGNLRDPLSVFNNPRNASATSAGIAATFNVAVAFEALLSATYQKMLDDNKTSGHRFSRGDSLSWTWQFCSEFGYFQDTNQTDPLNLISRFDNVTSFEYVECQARLPYAPKRPNIDAINGRYGGWHMKPSNIMFSNGELDTWRTLGVQSDLKINPSAYVRNSTKVVPPCNEPPPGDEVFGQIYPGQVHAQDLIKATYRNRTGYAPFDLGFELFTKALDEWLPCFERQHGHELNTQQTAEVL